MIEVRWSEGGEQYRKQKRNQNKGLGCHVLVMENMIRIIWFNLNS